MFHHITDIVRISQLIGLLSVQFIVEFTRGENSFVEGRRKEVTVNVTPDLKIAAANKVTQKGVLGPISIIVKTKCF